MHLVLTYRSKGLIKRLWQLLVQHLNSTVHIQPRVICKLFWKDYQQWREVLMGFTHSKLQGCRNLLNSFSLRATAQLQSPHQLGRLFPQKAC
uniref:Uncharacterized protein n=1 Tax=Rhizophora mucronata TaxID=61149 RepID=A0A2P2J5E8_RHIMU